MGRGARRRGRTYNAPGGDGGRGGRRRGRDESGSEDGGPPRNRPRQQQQHQAGIAGRSAHLAKFGNWYAERFMAPETSKCWCEEGNCLKNKQQRSRVTAYRCATGAGAAAARLRGGRGAGRVPRCPLHGQECLLRTANTAANPGRPFFKCAHPAEAEQCLRFLWADEWDGAPLGNNGGGRGAAAARVGQQSSPSWLHAARMAHIPP